jgi:hypothetical protein
MHPFEVLERKIKEKMEKKSNYQTSGLDEQRPFSSAVAGP